MNFRIRNSRVGSVILVCFLCGCEPEDYRLAYKYDVQGTNAEYAAKHYRLAAEQGYAKAQSSLARFYRDGRGGLPKDILEAEKWYRHAHAQGYAGAAYALGGMYQGHDKAQAVEWYKRAIEMGHVAAMSALGDCYLHGWGVPRDESEAVRLFRDAALHDWHVGARRLKEMGQPVPKPYIWCRPGELIVKVGSVVFAIIWVWRLTRAKRTDSPEKSPERESEDNNAA
jgi:Sel1 repeat-containing protein